MFRRGMRAAGISALVAGVLTTIASPIASDLLQGTIHPATATVDADETSPVLTNDGLSNVLVYTKRNVEGPGGGTIYYQRISTDGVPMGAPEPITFPHDEFTNNISNDASGSYVVYVSREPSNAARGIIRLYDIRTGGTINLTTVASNVRFPKIHGDIVAWVQGDGAASRVEFVDLTWPVLTPAMLPGTAGAVAVDVGSRYIVWEEFDGTSFNVEGYDMWAGAVVPVANDPARHERSPVTSGDYVVWQEQTGVSSFARTLHARDLTARAAPIVAADDDIGSANPSIDGDLIAFDSRRTGNPDVYVYRLSDGSTHQITSAAASDDRSHVFGNLVAFVHVAAGVGPELQTDISIAHLDSVIDDVPPTITCPANVTVAAGSGAASANVSYPDPSAGDNSLSLSVASSPESGSTFPLGATTVIGTAIDGAGNTASCAFTITVTSDPRTVLQAAIAPTTATPDSLETTPTLGFDGLSNIVVFTRVEQVGGQFAPGNIYYQRISATGVPLIAAEPITPIFNNSSDDRLNDVSGEYIVYSAWDPDDVLHGVIKLYQILNGSTVTLMPAADTVREAKVHGDVVVWVKGHEGEERIQMMDLTAQLLSAVTVSGGNPARNVEVGSRYIVWEEREGASSNVVAYEMATGMRIPVAADPVVHEEAPSTFGDWVVWVEQLATSTRIMARNLAARGAPFVVANPGAFVQNPGIDGDFITYESRISGNFDVYLYRLSTGTTHRITDGPTDDILNHVFGNLVAFVEVTDNDRLDISIAHLEFVAAPVTTLTLAPTTATYGGSVSLQATLSSAAGPVSGATVNFSVNGASVGSAVTSANGLATLNGVSVAGLNAGTYAGIVGASFAGSATLEASAAIGDLTIEQASTVTAFQVWQNSFIAGLRPSLSPGSTLAVDTSGNLIAWPNFSPEVWVLSGADGLSGTPEWTRYPTSGAPAGRANSAAAYNPANNTLTIFGGCASLCDPAFNDVWVLHHANGVGGTPQWTLLSPSVAVPPGHRPEPPPAPREAMARGYDAANDRLIIYAGRTTEQFSAQEFQDVWVLVDADGSGGAPQWVQLVPDNAPPPVRFGSSSWYDASSNRLIVAGGHAPSFPAPGLSNAVWALQNANGLGGTPHWVTLIPEGAAGSPPPFAWWPAAYDAAENRAMVVEAETPNLWVLENANGVDGDARWEHVNVPNPFGSVIRVLDQANAPYHAAHHRLSLFADDRLFVLPSAGATGWVTPSVTGQPVTLTVTVSAISPGEGIPTGTVTFGYGSNNTATVALDAAGQASFTTPLFPPSSSFISALYNGSANHTTSTSLFTHDLRRAGTTTDLTSSGSPAMFGAPVTFTATVHIVAPGAGTPIGTVTFKDGFSTLGTGTLDSNGKATFLAPFLSAGTHAITAVYSGDPGFEGSTSAVLSQSTMPTTTTTTVISFRNPSAFGESVELTATVEAATDVPLPGMVTFMEGDTTLGTANVGSSSLGTGTARLPVRSWAAGSHAITAIYSGDGCCVSGSTSPPITHVVQPAVPGIGLSSSPNPSVAGQLVTFTVTVSAPFGLVPTGTVQFKNGSVTLGEETLVDGQAVFTTDGLPVGSHTFTGVYGGDAAGNIAPGTSLPQVHTVRDVTPPVISVTNVTAEGTAPLTPVTFSFSATDDIDPHPTVTADRASGDLFPPGTTTVTVTARDASGNSSTATFTVTVVDTTAPEFTPPSNAIVNASAPAGAIYAYTTPVASDAVDVTVPVICSPASGSAFPIGTTTVTCTATDDAGNTTTRTFTVTVLSSEQIVANLIAQVENADFGRALGLLESVLRNLSRDNVNTACNQLSAFISQVEAQVEKSLSADEAATLMQLADDVRGSLGCG